MSFSFLSPWWAVLLLLLPLFWFRRNQLRNRWLPLLRSSVAALLVVGLMQPVWITQQAEATQVVIVDLSDSVGAQGAVRAKSLLQQVQQQHASAAAVIVVSSQADVLADTAAFNAGTTQQVGDISQALLQAEQLIPYGASGAITLISDGMATTAAWQQAVARLTARNIPLSILALKAQQAQPLIADVATQPWYKGQQFTAEVTIAGTRSDNEGNDLKLVLRQQGRDLAQLEDVSRQSQQLSISAELADSDTQSVDLLLLDGDNVISQKRLTVASQPAIPVLYISQQPQQQLATLLGAGFEVSTTTPEALEQVADLSQFAVLVMDDVASEQLPIAQQQRILTAVNQQGVGVFYAGGQQAFAKKELSSPLQQSLPLLADPQQQLKDPSVALAVIIDSSGSMEGQPVSLAKKIARLAVRKLQPTDQIGIVEFYGNKQWAVPMQPVAKSDEIERAIGRIQASGSTVLYPAIEEAYYGLKQTKTRFKHMLVISDAAVEEENYQQLLRAISQDGINVSTFLVGGGNSGQDKMQELANWGQGRFYLIEDDFSLVELDFHQPKPQPQANQQSGQFSVRDLVAERASFPDTTGYSKTALQSEAQLLLSLTNAASAQPIPFYATWPVGRGEIAALSNALFAPTMQQWQQWDGYGAWLAGEVTRIAHRPAAFSSKVMRDGDQVTLWLKRNAATALDAPQLTLVALGASSQQLPQPVVAERVALDWYRAQFNYPHDSDLLLNVVNGEQHWGLTDIAASDTVPEAEIPLSQQMPLAYIAQVTGGAMLAADADVDALPKPAPQDGNWDAIALARWFVLLALSLYLFEVILRRWPLVARQPGVRKSL
ncbi:VWA domain-containing protein [Shewanella sp. A3A]|nr:VWA domain-containing protein [Shewanella ferrihydritica]